MCALDNIFNSLNERVGIEERLKTIDYYFSSVNSATFDSLFNGYPSGYDKTIESAANGQLFLTWQHRNGTATPQHLREVLEITDLQSILKDRIRICHYLEYVYNMTALVFERIREFGGECNESIVLAVAGDVKSAAALLGMEIVETKDGRHILCVTDAPIIEAASIVEPEEMEVFVNYLHFANGGNLSRKGDCLAKLYKAYEGRMNKLDSPEFDNLKRDIGTIANSLGTRHNNREGKNANNVLGAMSDGELEKWFDYLVGLFAEAVLAERRVDMRATSKELRKKLSR